MRTNILYHILFQKIKFPNDLFLIQSLKNVNYLFLKIKKKSVDEIDYFD